MITYEPQDKLFTIHGAGFTYQMQVDPYGFLVHLYYGKAVAGSSMQYLLELADRGFSGVPDALEKCRNYSLDFLPLEYPAFGAGDYRTSCIAIRSGDGSSNLDLRYSYHRILNEKTAPAGLPHVHSGSSAQWSALEIVLADPAASIEVTLTYSLLENSNILTRFAKIHNISAAEGKPVLLEKALSACLDFNTAGFDFITFYGRHAMERCVERSHTRHGILEVGSVRGASSHQQNPFVILCNQDAGETHGDCYGVSLVYSGNFTVQAEVSQFDQTRLVMGIHPDGFQWKLDPGEVFYTPEIIFCYSPDGLGDMSRKLHRLIRDHICRGDYQYKRRPILINNWEGTYFHFDDEKLVEIARQAGELGVEMLVMDDGWFGKRDNDLSGLGDWVVNTQKLKGGLDGLCRQINALGMKLGIWFEPEMISEDSDLYRSHPDWRLHVPGRSFTRSRHQLVLDMSRQDVRDYLFQAISKILQSANIEYVKWDMNRHLSDVWSAQLPADRQGEVFHRHILGVYDFMERLTTAFPHVLFESCSGGGGRFDTGMLYYMPQAWCSDDTDAMERIKIQYGTSFGYPVSTVGAHVSACPNHQTGRTTPLETRGVVAMAGTFGYELDMSKMSPEEKELIKSQIQQYLRFYDVINDGDYCRLTNPWEQDDYAAWQFVSQDQKKSLVNYVQIRARANAPFVKIKFQLLRPDALYQVSPAGGTDSGKIQPCILSGSALMYAGYRFPLIHGDGASIQLELTQI